MGLSFDATITLNDRHLDLAGLDGPKAAAAVRQAVEPMDGAAWIASRRYPTRHICLGG